MTRPILYSFRRCPFAMRARMALDAAQIDVEHREVLLRDKPAELLKASPKGTVPVLVLPHCVLEESLDIMEWALARQDPENWLSHPDDRQHVESFLDAFKDSLDRYKYPSRYNPDVARGDVDKNQRATAMEVLSAFADPLKNQAFLGGKTPSLRDIATFPFVRQFAAVEPDWWTQAATEPLQNWLQHFLETDRFRRVMAKHPRWAPLRSDS